LVLTKSLTSSPLMPEPLDSHIPKSIRVIPSSMILKRDKLSNGSRTNQDISPTSLEVTTLVEWLKSSILRNTSEASVLFILKTKMESLSQLGNQTFSWLETKSLLLLSLKVTVNILTFWKKKLSVKRKEESPVLQNDDEYILNNTIICLGIEFIFYTEDIVVYL